jgi:hypothetical protein
MRPDAGYTGLLVPICAVRNVHHEPPVWTQEPAVRKTTSRPRDAP